MGYGRNTVFILDSRSDRYGARTFTDVYFLETSVWLGFIAELALVGGDIYVFRVEFLQLVNYIIHLLDTVTFQRR